MILPQQFIFKKIDQKQSSFKENLSALQKDQIHDEIGQGGVAWSKRREEHLSEDHVKLEVQGFEVREDLREFGLDEQLKDGKVGFEAGHGREVVARKDLFDEIAEQPEWFLALGTNYFLGEVQLQELASKHAQSLTVTDAVASLREGKEDSRELVTEVWRGNSPFSSDDIEPNDIKELGEGIVMELIKTCIISRTVLRLALHAREQPPHLNG